MGVCLCEFESRSGHHRREEETPHSEGGRAVQGPAASLCPVTAPDTLARIRACYDGLLSQFGPQGWWPGQGAFEVVVGSVLTQNTSWKNVERALEGLRAAGAMSPEGMSALPHARLEELIRAAGFWRRKAHTLRELVAVRAQAWAGDPPHPAWRAQNSLRGGPGAERSRPERVPRAPGGTRKDPLQARTRVRRLPPRVGRPRRPPAG